MQDLNEHKKLWEDAMFEDATFHSKGLIHDKTPQWMLFALALNLSLVTVLLIKPLVYPDRLPLRSISQLLYTPPAPAQITRQVMRSSQQSAPAATAMRLILRVPTHPPTGIDTRPDPGPPAPVGCLDCGETSVLGADGPPQVFRTTTPPLVRPAPAQKLRISSMIAGSLAVSQAQPIYPAIAKATGTSGTVVLAATISKSGTIENLRVVSGPGMLRQAALDAVQQWKYKPYLLNGEPVEVETSVNVVFSLSGR